ncbi:MAG: hypothetical protein ABIU87_10325 [Ornithinibacter sp.]
MLSTLTDVATVLSASPIRGHCSGCSVALPSVGIGGSRRARGEHLAVHVGDQGRAQGVAGFSRLEGTIFHKGVVYFTSTQGGGAVLDGTNRSGYGTRFG